MSEYHSKHKPQAILLDLTSVVTALVVRFDLGPLLQGQTKVAKLKSAYNSLIIGRTGLGC